MSVVIGYSCSRFSLIATDTRVIVDNSLGEIVDYTDRNIKLNDLENLGFEASSGLNSFLDNFHKGLDKRVSDKDEVVSLFNKCLSGYKCRKEDEQILNSTAVMVSFKTQEDTNTVCKNAVISPSGINIIEDEKIFILYPLEYINNRDLIENLEKKFSLEYHVNEDSDVEGLIKYIIEIFKEINSNSNRLSPYCHVGVLEATWKEDYKYYILDNTSKTILKRLNDNMDIESVLTKEQLNRKLAELSDEGIIEYEDIAKINLTKEGRLILKDLI